MKKVLLILSTLVVYLSAEIAFVKTVQGKVLIKRIYDILPVKIGDTLNVGDILLTDKNSSVGIIFDDGSRLTLGSKSHILIEKYIFKPSEQKFAFDLNMTKGKALFESGKFGTTAPEKFKFKIPEGIIGIHGTKFYVDIR